VRGVGEAGGQGAWVVGVAGEGNGLAAFLPPSGEDLGMQRHPGIDFEDLPGVGQGPQQVPVLILELARVEGAGVARPVADRVIDVGEDLEGVEPADQRGGFGQVVAQQGRGPAAVPVGFAQLDAGSAGAIRQGSGHRAAATTR
jgi:hypothetical protein